jgi:hypothetical protein
LPKLRTDPRHRGQAGSRADGSLEGALTQLEKELATQRLTVQIIGSINLLRKCQNTYRQQFAKPKKRKTGQGHTFTTRNKPSDIKN